MTTPSAIDVRDQRPLGLARTFALCLKGIKHRLFRSFLTFAVIVLAVSFFMYLLGSSVDARAVHAGVVSETALVRHSPQALELWFGRPSTVVMGHRLANAQTTELAQIAAVTGVPAARIAVIATACRAESQLLEFLDGLDAGTRAALVKKAKGRDVLGALADPLRWNSFVEALAQLKTLRPPLPIAAIQAVVAARSDTAAGVAELTTAWNANGDRLRAAVAAVAGSEAPERWQEWFASADQAGVMQAAAILAAHGFSATASMPEITAVQEGLRSLRLRDRVAAALNDGACIAAWKKAFLASPSVDEKMLLLDDERVVTMLGGTYTRTELANISRSIAHERRLAELEKSLAGKVPAEGDLISGRQLFLVTISFVVCMVGIANAMLMAITERFREIATMKCLGATDGYILTQFLMEAGMQGVAGGLLGMVFGAVLALAMDGYAYGGHLFNYLPLIGLLVCAGLCVVAGFVLATLASIYPSWMASRMAPMDAMRVE